MDFKNIDLAMTESMIRRAVDAAYERERRANRFPTGHLIKGELLDLLQTRRYSPFREILDRQYDSRFGIASMFLYHCRAMQAQPRSNKCLSNLPKRTATNSACLALFGSGAQIATASTFTGTLFASS